jgi:calcium-dependent protein kinase
MVDRVGEIKLIDFGLATKYQSEEYANLTDTVGTLYSMAPQVLEGSGYDFKADLWSVGVVTYILLSRMQPFWGPMTQMSWPKRRRIMMDLILKCQYAPMKEGVWDSISAHAKGFVGSLLQYDPKLRPTASEALTSNWIQSSSQIPSGSVEKGIYRRVPSLEQTQAMRSLHHATEFRRRAWRLLTTKFGLSDVERLEARLGEAGFKGQGYVEIDTLLCLIQVIGRSSLSREDMNVLQGELSLAGTQHRIEYIDFITEVKRGRKRNLLDNLVSKLDEMDVDNSRQVKLTSILSLLDKNVIPEEFRGEFERTVMFLRDFHGEDGTISTLQVLKWMEKRITREQVHAIEHV